MDQEFKFTYQRLKSSEELSAEDQQLLEKARAATSDAYAPYSNFNVSAVAKMENGEIVKGTNQENASYPVGICAERVLLSTISSMYPNSSVETMAISYDNKNGVSNHPISPCGMCRQALVEYEGRTGQPIKLIMAGQKGEVIVLETAKRLLPFSFSVDDMK
ncbi:MAG: cytidine deaminase [Ferruginibacter sp.]